MCISHKSTVGLLKGVGQVFLRETPHRRTLGKYSQGMKQEAEVGRLVQVIHWPAGGVLAHLKGACRGKIPAMVESLKSPSKMFPEKVIQHLGLCPMHRTSGPSYNRISEVNLSCSSSSLPCPLQSYGDQREQVVKEEED